MPKDGDASVLPSQPWREDGTATATPLPPFPDLLPRTLQLDNRTAGNQTVRRSDYAQGLVIVQTGHEPTTTPSVLALLRADGDEYRVTGDKYIEFPDGFVIWFTVQ